MGTPDPLEEQSTMSQSNDVGKTPQFKRVSVDRLRSGAVLKYPIYDEKRTKLVGEKTGISNSFIEQLKRRRVYSVIVEQSDLIRLKKL